MSSEHLFSQGRQPIAQGHRAYTWESSSLKHGGQRSHHAISLQPNCMMLKVALLDAVL